MNRYKYPRTPHLPWSLGRDRDDRFLTDTLHFQGHEVVVTEKLDGECTTIYPDGYVHARSVDGKAHPSQAWVKNLAGQISWMLPTDYRIVGENLYAKHSIAYNNLPGFFYMFALFGPHHYNHLRGDAGILAAVPADDCLRGWDETVAMAGDLGLHMPRVLYRGLWNPQRIRDLERGMNFEETEGYVVRRTDWCYTNLFHEHVAKFVRPDHVKTEKRWNQTWQQNQLA